VDIFRVNTILHFFFFFRFGFPDPLQHHSTHNLKIFFNFSPLRQSSFSPPLCFFFLQHVVIGVLSEAVIIMHVGY
jgi:hypothetical protein